MADLSEEQQDTLSNIAMQMAGATHTLLEQLGFDDETSVVTVFGLMHALAISEVVVTRGIEIEAALAIGKKCLDDSVPGLVVGDVVGNA